MHWRLQSPAGRATSFGQIAGVSILAFQLAMIVLRAFRAFPLFLLGAVRRSDGVWITTVVNGRKLTGGEIRERYRRPQHGTDNRSPQHVIDILQGVEETI